MNNIDPKTVELQKKVIEKFNPLNIPHLSMSGEISHAMFIDYVWALNGQPPESMKQHNIKRELDFDAVLFLDIDCVPLNDKALQIYLSRAVEGVIIGNAQRSSHLNNNNHLFAAPSAIALSCATFDKIGRPSALETARSDVIEEYTWAAGEANVEVELALPTKYDGDVYRYPYEKDRRPYWTLENGLPNYGLGTTFGSEGVGDLFWHNFQIFLPGQQERFWKKCEELLNG
jgi:hypothetical protein